MNKKITDINDTSKHRERVKKRFLESGPDSFQDYELLELLLFYCIPRKDTKSVAKGLLREFGSVRGILNARYSQLVRCEGIGRESAILITMLKSLLTRYHRPENEKQLINCSEDAVNFASTLFFGRQKEELYVVCLNIHNRVVKHKKIAEGSFHHVDLELRDIIEAAIFYNASKVILAHNHPGNNLQPSDEDIRLNNDITEALAKIDIPLLDHIIVGEGGGYSMRLNRLIEARFMNEMHIAAEDEE
jgi:DNA repair protein RadC